MKASKQPKFIMTYWQDAGAAPSAMLGVTDGVYDAFSPKMTDITCMATLELMLEFGGHQVTRCTEGMSDPASLLTLETLRTVVMFSGAIPGTGRIENTFLDDLLPGLMSTRLQAELAISSCVSELRARQG